MANELRDLARTVYQAMLPGSKYEPRKLDITDTLFARIDKMLADLALSVVAGLQPKAAVSVATTDNTTYAALVPGAIIDGYTLAAGNRVIVQANTNASQNGIVVVQASGAAIRATDADTGAELQGAAALVLNGTTYGGSVRWVTTSGNITLGTTSVTWGQMFSSSFISSTLGEVDSRTRDSRSLSGYDFRRGWRFIWAIQDNIDDVAAGLTNRLGWYVRWIKMSGNGHSFRRSPIFWLFTGRDRAGLVGVDRFRRLDVPAGFTPRTLAKIGTTIDPATWGGEQPVSVVYPPVNGKQIAQVQETKAPAYLVKRNIGATYVDGLYVSTAPMVLDTWAGQSGAGNSGTTTDPNVIYTAQYPHNWVMLAGQGYAVRGSQTIYTPENINDFAPLKEYAFGSTYGDWQSLGVLSAIVQEEMARDDGRPTEGGGMLLAWQGGQPLEKFIPPTPDYPVSQASDTRNWARLLSSVTAFARIALNNYGRSTVIQFHHYPSNEGGATSPIESNNLWFTMFRDYYVAQVKAALKAITGQAEDPHIIMTQNVTQADAVSPFAVIAAQLEAAKYYDGNGVTCFGPMYPYPVDPDVNDRIHAITIGRMQAAELIEVVKARIRAGIKHRPMWVESATLTGAVIDLTFGRPYGSGDLKFDTDTIAAITNQGFRVQVSGADVTINSVTIPSANVLRITLAAAPAAGTKVEALVAYGGSSITVVPSWSRCRTTLMREDVQPSVFYRRGYPVPKFVRHHPMNEIYLVRSGT